MVHTASHSLAAEGLDNRVVIGVTRQVLTVAVAVAVAVAMDVVGALGHRVGWMLGAGRRFFRVDLCVCVCVRVCACACARVCARTRA